MFNLMESIKVISSLTSIMGGIVMGVNGITYWKKKIEYKKRLERFNHNLDPNIVINLSDHPITLCENNWHFNKRIIDIKISNVNVMDPDGESDRIIGMFIKDYGYEVFSSTPIVYALPGMSILTQYLITKIHGLSGDFPYITMAVKTDSGYLWKEPVNLHRIRTSQRFYRDKY